LRAKGAASKAATELLANRLWATSRIVYPDGFELAVVMLGDRLDNGERQRANEVQPGVLALWLCIHPSPVMAPDRVSVT
jgi:hypothetical protein